MRVVVGAATAVVAVVVLPATAEAQDGGLDPLLFAHLENRQIRDLDATSLQIYRIPLSAMVRDPGDRGWGLRLTFPVSLSSSRIEADTDLGELVANVEVASVIPGVELVLPVGDRWWLKPFAEIGVGRGGADTEVLYAAGIRARGDFQIQRAAITVGAAAAYKKPATSRSRYDAYSRMELGIDAQVPLGLGLHRRRLSGGVYAIVRGFSDLDLATAGDQPIRLDHQYEVGLSFSTEPALSVWKIRTPWVGFGYQFGDVFHGVRVYLSFPF
jgi:hypothetical protein